MEFEKRLESVSRRITTALGPACREFETWAKNHGLDLTRDDHGDFTSKVTVVARQAFKDGWKTGRCSEN